jgi:hypothetical protein
VHPDHIRLEPEATGHIPIHVRMRVDHSWQHELIGHIDDILRRIFGQSCCHRGNAPIL